jgi:hypothetical protein
MDILKHNKLKTINYMFIFPMMMKIIAGFLKSRFNYLFIQKVILYFKETKIMETILKYPNQKISSKNKDNGIV